METESDIGYRESKIALRIFLIQSGRWASVKRSMAVTTHSQSTASLTSTQT